MKGAKIGIGEFIQHYNYQRPHQALKYEKPADLFFPRDKKRYEFL